MFSFWNLNNDTAIGSRFFVYVKDWVWSLWNSMLSKVSKVYMCIVYWTVHLVDQHSIIYVLLWSVNWKWCERKLLLPNLRCTILTHFPEGLWLNSGPGTYKIQNMVDVPDLTVKLWFMFIVRLSVIALFVTFFAISSRLH